MPKATSVKARALKQQSIGVSPTYGLFLVPAYGGFWTVNYIFYSVLKRVMDLFFATVLLVTLAPLFVLVSIMIKLDSPGPVLFKQERVGKNGKVFKILKFRSMTADNDMRDHSCADKYTKVGKFIRRTSIDELPQLFNVLAGQMSFVGPRPWVMDYWNNMNAEERERSRVLPGITGLAQVKGRNGISIFKKIEWDLTYVRNYSLWQDFKVILLTIFTVFSGSGVDAGKEGMRDDIKDLRGR